MDIDKLIHFTRKAIRDISFSSLMDIDKLIQPRGRAVFVLPPDGEKSPFRGRFFVHNSLLQKRSLRGKMIFGKNRASVARFRRHKSSFQKEI